MGYPATRGGKMKLADKTCKTAKPKDKPYKLFDGGGLYLEILPTGKKLWRLKYYCLNKEKRISLGAYPLVALAGAHEARGDAKKLLSKDIDPSTARKDKNVRYHAMPKIHSKPWRWSGMSRTKTARVKITPITF